MSRRLALIAGAVGLVAAGAVVVALAAGGDGGCGGGYPQTPRCMAEAFVLRDDGSKCDLVEPTLLEEVMGVRGPDAREQCARMVEARPGPEKLEILRVEEEDESAETGRAGEEEGEAAVEFLADGKEGEIQLRRIAGRWRIVALGEG